MERAVKTFPARRRLAPDVPSRFASPRALKERHLQELAQAQRGLQSVFGPDPLRLLFKTGRVSPETRSRQVVAAERAYNLLRPKTSQVKPYQEEIVRDVHCRLQSLIQRASPKRDAAGGVPLSQPPRVYALAVDALSASLAADVAALLAHVHPSGPRPRRWHPRSLEKALDTLSFALRLERHPQDAERWGSAVWPGLRDAVFSTAAAARRVSAASVIRWLRAHLRKVIANTPTKWNCPKRSTYDLSRDFAFHSCPVDYRVLDALTPASNFPFETAGALLRNLLRLRSGRARLSRPEEKAAATFQILVNELRGVGLEKWLQPAAQDALQQRLPRLTDAELENSLGAVDASDIEAARELLIKMVNAQEGAVYASYPDPLALFLPHVERSRYCGHRWLQKVDVEETAARRGYGSKGERHDKPLRVSVLPMKDIVAVKKEDARTQGPIEWLEQDGEMVTWRWKRPAGTRPIPGGYIPAESGLSTQLTLQQLRVVPLEVKRVTKDAGTGRWSFNRVVAAVGDGHGFFGTAAGSALLLRDALREATLRAIRDAQFIDHDPSGILMTPVQGREYKQYVTFRYVPAPLGLKVKARHLPLMYTMGFTNASMRFARIHCCWLTRHRALRRALEGILSRRTLATATGKRYALLAAPGDHWVHWPDRWFVPVLRQHARQAQEIRRSSYAVWHKAGRRGSNLDATPAALKLRFAAYDTATQGSPLQTVALTHKRNRAASVRAAQSGL